MKRYSLAAVALSALVLTGCAPTQPTAQQQLERAAIGALAAPALGGISGKAQQTPALVNLLMGKLNVNHQQAAGGAGAIFSLAQKTLAPTQFGQLRNAVPGMDMMLAAAPSLAPANSGALGMAGHYWVSQQAENWALR